ncbi:hypothetical protein HPB52_022099 [Rhipicephalus sanguineus]|uniref:GB1/RHD3-type G domain-containing protein n=1 Tax=Rhipicephalus sanguineus TaxID=34632 RepID=A0A9D4PGG0_RHISA|nr:hypothetical protein HPB52_022099 [Rhipicephalus sanguineus]
MSDRVDSGQPLNILNVDGRSLELDEHGLARLLLDERVKDKPVVVIAVAGAFRKGKSFLLCFLIRYLRSEGRAEWLGDPNAPLEGFGWRGGSERHTTGILMWNEVFLVKTSQGNELAVLLMDTQGTFDCESASVVHASIFALSAMISSVLVYNVSQNIQQNDLQHLKDFIEYGMMTILAWFLTTVGSKLCDVQVGSTRPFQSLMFLVRDWQFEMPYGLAGGQQLLEKRLKGPPNQDRELRQLRRKLSKCFRKMHCFLMPHPGLTVAQEGFDGRLSDIGETFKLHLSEFVRLLLEPDNLQPKKINGREITCLELLSYIKVYVGATKRGLLDDPSQMLEATHAGSCRAAMDKSLDFYTTSMLSLWQNSPDDDADRETMRRYHNELRKVAVEQYSAAPKMGGELPAQLYLHKLKEAVFKHVAFKVAHGFLTTGLAAAAIALAVVELPVVAIALGAFGAASLSGHLVQVIVEMELAKRKRKERHENSKAAAEAAKRRGFGGADIEEFDDEVPLFAAEDDTGSVLSLELAESAATSPEPPVTVTDGAETTRGNRSSTAAGASNGRDGSDDCIPLVSTQLVYYGNLQGVVRGSVSDGVGSGHELQIVRTSDECIELDESALKRLLLDERVKDKPVAVVSVAGAFRTGKSFLLGFFLRYLQNSNRSSWLGDENSPLRGFKWRDGCERHTTGILVWNEVFLVKTSQGQEIAVLLMDTQGMHDDHSTIKESATIFALSTMMSSVLVYNLSQNIQESDLQYLQLFADYGRLAQQQRAGKPFQKLLFLVRDWYHLRDAEYGVDGGREILKRRLQISEHQPKQLQELRQYIDSSFTEMDCFLLPHPGTKVATGTSFDGRLSEIDEDFKKQLQDLVPSLLAPDNLTVKKINGEELTCGEFHIYMKAYVDVFNGGELPEPMSVLQATARANNLAAVFKALKLYTTRMTQVRSLLSYRSDTQTTPHTQVLQLRVQGAFSAIGCCTLQEIDEWFQDFASRVALKSCLESNRCKKTQLGGAMIMTVGAGVSLAAGAHVAVPVVLVCGVLGLLLSLAVTGFKGCTSDPKEESREMNERVCLVEVHDELLDGRQKSPAEATGNLRRRQAAAAASDIHTIDLEVVEPPENNAAKRKGKKKNFLKRFFTKKRRNSRGPTELDRLKRC